MTRSLTSKNARKKGIIALLLAMVLVLTCFPISGFANEGEEPEDVSESYEEEAEDPAEEEEGEDEPEEDSELLEEELDPDEETDSDETEEEEAEDSEGEEPSAEDGTDADTNSGSDEADKDEGDRLDFSTGEEEEVEKDQVWLYMPREDAPTLKVDYVSGDSFAESLEILLEGSDNGPSLFDGLHEEPEIGGPSIFDDPEETASEVDEEQEEEAATQSSYQPTELERMLGVPAGYTLSGWLDEDGKRYDADQPLEGGTVKLWAKLKDAPNGDEEEQETENEPEANQVWLYLPGESSPAITFSYQVGDLLEQGLEYQLNLPENSVFTGWLNENKEPFDVNQPLEGGLIELWANLTITGENAEERDADAEETAGEETPDPEADTEQPAEDAEPDQGPLSEGIANLKDLLDGLEEEDEVTVTFTYADGRPIDTQVIHKGGRVIAPNHEDEIPTDTPNATFAYWYNPADGVDGEGLFIPFDFNKAIEEDITLHPFFDTAFYIHFETKGETINPIRVESGVIFTKEMVEHLRPKRVGFEFDYWSETPDGLEYGFDQPINHELVLHAVWKGEEVEYSVVYWVEKENLPDIFDKSDINNYMALHTKTKAFKANAGSTITISADDAAASEWWKEIVYDSADAEKFDPWHYEFHAAPTTEVLGNGATVVNVFYTRKWFTIKFRVNSHINGKTKPDIVVMHVNGQDYYAGEVYTMRARLGQDITDRFPNAYNSDGTYNYTFNTDDGKQWKLTYWAYEGDWIEILPKHPSWSRDLKVMTSDMIPIKGTEYEVMSYFLIEMSGTYIQYMVRLPEGEGPPEDYKPKELRYIKDDAGNWYEEMPERSAFVNLVGLVHTPIPGLNPLGYEYSGYRHSEDNSIDPLVGYTRVYPSSWTEHWKLHHINEARNQVLLYERQEIDIKFRAGTFSDGTAPDNPANIKQYYGYPVYDLVNEVVPDHDPSEYTFLGWYTDKELKFPLTEDYMMPAMELTLYGRWVQADYHTVSFYAEPNGELVFKDYYNTNDYVSIPNLYQIEQAVEGYGEFQGWQWYRPNTSTLVDYPFETPVTKDIALYGSWKKDALQVTFDPDGGYFPQGNHIDLPDGPYNAGSVFPIPDTRLEAIIDGSAAPQIAWRRTSDGRTYYHGNHYTVWGDTTFKAVYEDKNTVYKKITFQPGDGGDGKFVGGVQPAAFTWTVGYNEYGITMPDRDAFKGENYRISGWMLTDDDHPDRGTIYKPGEFVRQSITRDMTFTAQWEPNPEIKMNFVYYDVEGTKLGERKNVVLERNGFNSIPDWNGVVPNPKTYTGLYYQLPGGEETPYISSFKATPDLEGETVDVYLASTVLNVSLPVGIHFYTSYGEPVTSGEYKVYNYSQLAVEMSTHYLRVNGGDSNVNDDIHFVEQVNAGSDENQMSLQIKRVSGGFERDSGPLPVNDKDAEPVWLGTLKSRHLEGEYAGSFKISGEYHGRRTLESKRPEVEFVFSISLLTDFNSNLGRPI